MVYGLFVDVEVGVYSMLKSLLPIKTSKRSRNPVGDSKCKSKSREVRTCYSRRSKFSLWICRMSHSFTVLSRVLRPGFT